MTCPTELLIRRDSCRICSAQLSDEIVGFDALPVAGAYVFPDDPPPDPIFPLTLLRCSACGLVQLRESLAPSFYSRYSFMSGVAGGYRSYLSLLTADLSERCEPGTRVLEVGCSDGTLLKLLHDSGFVVAGFEPATKPARAAVAKGLLVVNDFCYADSAAQCGFGPADVVIARHVLEHIDNFSSIFAGIDKLASPDAMLLIEVPDLACTIQKSIYSNIYHVHPCYFELDTISALLDRYGWKAKGSTSVDIFGGSLLLWAQRKGARSGWGNQPNLCFARIACHPAPRATRASLKNFADNWKAVARATRDFFDELRDRGVRVAGYGAAERTSALMGVAGIDSSHVSPIFDLNPNLVGKALPGNRIPILHPDTIFEHDPEYLVIFAQSFEEEIVGQQKAFRDAGGKFISLRSNSPEVFA